MGKLIGQIFKEDFKNIILWLILPLISSFILMKLYEVFETSALIGIAIVISFTLLMVGPIIALSISTDKDMKRFYDKESSFYSTLPYKSSQIIGARFINYILIGILSFTSFIVNFIILGLAQKEQIYTLSDIFDGIKTIIANIGLGRFALIILVAFSVLITLISMLLLSSTATGSKYLAKYSKSAALFVFIILLIIIGFSFSYLQANVLLNNLNEVKEINGMGMKIVTNISNTTFIIPILFNLVLSSVMYAISYLLHDKKLSVN
ncbi:hypothetical protein [Anaerococcus sp. Marseille-P3625]|uniref:hypothetical protein n=1 Tax=Anaerococcus sp. Marseille-P3625 TaxID=1977277 RepID=UPI000C07FE9F|nr:hypothetical protein [Anaerococcus sp. Marseille-P3625]